VLGVPVYLSLSTLVLIVIIAITYSGSVHSSVPALSTSQTYAVAVVFALLLLVSVFLHELGHSLISQTVGVRVRSITLMMLGGVTVTEGEARDAGSSCLISAAGPLVSLFLSCVGALITRFFEPGTVAYVISAQVTVTNLLVTAFNLLPGLPLDGGQLLRSGVWRITGSRHTGTIAAAWAGRVLAGLLVVAALLTARLDRSVGAYGLLFSLFIALYMWQGASQSLRMAELHRRLPRLQAGSMARPAVGVPAETPLSEALRRLGETGARGIVVVDRDGHPGAVVIEEAVAATPEQRRPWISVSAVARGLDAGLLLPADLAGEDVLQAIQSNPASEYVVVDRAGRLVGVLATADVAAVLDPAAAR
jgi:Zn-dependent protease